MQALTTPYIVFFALLLLALPVCIFLLLFFFGKKLYNFSDKLAISGMTICLGLSIVIFIYTWPDRIFTAQLHWFSMADHTFTLGVLIDKLSAFMLVLVTFISLLVQVYSTAYMKGDAKYSLYFAYLGLFTAAMLGIVLANNLLLLYIAWELVGVSSYLLIGFWREKPDAALASRNAFLINRIGDTGFLIGILILFVQFGTFDLQILTTANLSDIDTTWLIIAGLGLFSGCVAKSAQFPLQIWLPGAMAGPTPVSALIHAATMVAAGVFLLARVYPLLHPDVLTVIAVTGTITAFMGAVAALFQTDIKRLLAFSTISQLGYMVMAMGVGAYDAALFHLLTHAFFKACLFLSAGAVIHALHQAEHQFHISFDAQDMRLMGGLRNKMPFTFGCYLVAGLSLAGLPLLSGFLSKDAILLSALTWADRKPGFWWFLVPDFGFITALLTAAYIGRQLILVFAGELRLQKYFPSAENIRYAVQEVPLAMKLPMGLLALLSVFLFFSWNPLNAETGWFTIAMYFPGKTTSDSWHMFTGIASAVLSFTGLGIAYYFTNNSRMRKPLFLRNLSVHNWYMEEAYRSAFIRSGLVFTQVALWMDTKVIDKCIDYIGIAVVVLAHIVAWIDRTFVDGAVYFTAFVAGRIGLLTKSFQGGKIQTYFVYALFGLILLIVWIIL